MPKPLTPTSPQEIIPISPPIKVDLKPKISSFQSRSTMSLKPQLASASKTLSHMSNYASTSTRTPDSENRSTILPTPHTFQPSAELKGKIIQHVRADKYLQQIGEVPTPGDPGSSSRLERKGKRKFREEEVEKERLRLEESGMGRERVTQRMVCRTPSSALSARPADVNRCLH